MIKVGLWLYIELWTLISFNFILFAIKHEEKKNIKKFHIKDLQECKHYNGCNKNTKV